MWIMISSTIAGVVFSMFFAYYATTPNGGDGYGATFLLGMVLSWIVGGLFWAKSVRFERREYREGRYGEGVPSQWGPVSPPWHVRFLNRGR